MSPIDGAAEIDDERLVTSVELALELVGRDSGDPQAAEEALAPDPLDDDIPDDDPVQRHGQGRAELTGPGDHPLDCLSGSVAQGHPGSRPDERPHRAIEGESEHPDAHDARERRPHRAEPGDELGEQEKPYPVTKEDILRSADARVRLEGYAAEQGEHPGAARRPTVYQVRSATSVARTPRPTAPGRLRRPAAASPPAAIRTGAAGMGTPSWSASTYRNSTISPCWTTTVKTALTRWASPPGHFGGSVPVGIDSSRSAHLSLTPAKDAVRLHRVDRGSSRTILIGSVRKSMAKPAAYFFFFF